ncbi:MAG: hypothetical protein J6Y48_02585 [Clostridia bacterium]|nr:hypothetical protein [Clostridia bacterium]
MNTTVITTDKNGKQTKQTSLNQLVQAPEQKNAYPSSGYQGLQGVNNNTANQVANYQNGYQAGQQVQNAQQQMQNVQAQKPATYNSKYSAQLDSILQQVTNPEKFKYSFNGDELFKSYADLYTQKGKQASLDSMGQAAALTGGYGNSYAQQAGNQQYQQYLLGLYDKGMDLYDRAYQRYLGDQEQRQNAYNMLANADQTDYGRYRDTVGDWQNELDYWTNMYNTESDRDYSRYGDQRDYWTQLAQVENADYRSEQERQEAIRQFNMNYEEQQRQFNENLAETRRQFDEKYEYEKMSEQQKYAYNYAMAILEKGQMPSDEMLKAAGLSKEDAKKLMKQVTSGGGGGPKKTTDEQVQKNTPGNESEFGYGYDSEYDWLKGETQDTLREFANQDRNLSDQEKRNRKGGNTKDRI